MKTAPQPLQRSSANSKEGEKLHPDDERSENNWGESLRGENDAERGVAAEVTSRVRKELGKRGLQVEHQHLSIRPKQYQGRWLRRTLSNASAVERSTKLVTATRSQLFVSVVSAFVGVSSVSELVLLAATRPGYSSTICGLEEMDSRQRVVSVFWRAECE